MTPIEMRNAKFGPIVAKNLTNRGFEAVYVATKEEALAQAYDYQASVESK